MRSTFSSAAAVVAALTPLASAVINITMDTSNGVTVGHEYPVIITSDTDYDVGHLYSSFASEYRLLTCKLDL